MDFNRELSCFVVQVVENLSFKQKFAVFYEN
jgi:hypothetical protein